MSINDPTSSSPSEITLKHLSSALMTAVLMQRAARCMTARQAYVLATTAIFQEQSLHLPEPRRESWYLVLCVNVLVAMRSSGRGGLDEGSAAGLRSCRVA
jgi:hypothetical protein